MVDRRNFIGKSSATILAIVVLVYVVDFVLGRMALTQFSYIGLDLSGQYSVYAKHIRTADVSDQRYIAVHDKSREAFYIQLNQVSAHLYTRWHLEDRNLMLEGAVDGEHISMLWGDSYFAEAAKVVGDQVQTKLGNKDRHDSVKFMLP